MLSETERAWLAGFLDADGMIRLKIGQKNATGPKSFIPLATYTNTCAMSVKHIAATLAKSEVNFKAAVARRKNGWAEKVTIEIAGLTRVVPFLNAVRPYLVTKALEADLLLRFAQIRAPHSRSPYGEMEYRIFEALKFLKTSRHLRDYMPSADDILGEDIVRSNAKVLEEAEMTSRVPLEDRREWARKLVKTYRWDAGNR